MTMKNKCCLHLLGARYLDLQRYARFFDNGILCVAFLNEALCVTFEIELLKFCFSPLEFVVVLRVRLSCLTGSATKSIPLAVKQPSKDRSGDGDLIICCAAISISGSVEIRGLNARFNIPMSTLTNMTYSPIITMEPMVCLLPFRESVIIM